MLFGLVVLFLITLDPTRTAVNLYNTEPIGSDANFRFHCLSYSSRREWDLFVSVEYCFRPLGKRQDWLSEGFLGDEHVNYTFDQLARLNITAPELRSWSVSADSVEDYQSFLDHRDNRLAWKEIVRCAGVWFGPRCQYSFDIPNMNNFLTIVQRIVRNKMSAKVLNSESYVTCYSYLNCTDQGVPICLDWAQICDGRIDCIDGGEDETSCFQMEMNECQANQYRCHNGQCIDEEFSDNEMLECLDQTDFLVASSGGNLVAITDFIWAEYHCSPGDENFVCGDGQCVRDFQQCSNGRHLNLIHSTSDQHTLTTDCWKALLCLTKLVPQMDRRPCQQSVSTCDVFIQFPAKPVLLHHVRFLYHRDHLRLFNHTSQAAIPTYICYDPHLCEHLHPTFDHHNLTCRHSSLFGLDSSASHPTWISIIDTIRPFFHGCMLPAQRRPHTLHPSLYCCHNSSKCISQHRLIDGIVDCPHGDDEQAVEQSCAIPHPSRFRCHNEQQCRSPLFPPYVCPPRPYRGLKELLFHEICDRIQHTAPELIDGQNHTDESECGEWPCNNIYTRCDHFWNCPNSEDEFNCSSLTLTSTCPPVTLQCLSIVNYTMICLPGKQVEDGVIDCLGGADEQMLCRKHDADRLRHSGFVCSNDTHCLVTTVLCDGRADCPLGDDEVFCGERTHICAQHLVPFRSDADKLLCRLRSSYRDFFSFHTLPVYPPLINTSVQVDLLRESQSTMPRTLMQSTTTDISHVWYCHRGLSVRVRLDRDRFEVRCLCPPTFFGDRCEYQTQRVSVTLRVHPVRRRGAQSFLISLISDDSHWMHSYHQARYAVEDSCGKTFKFFLLFSTRPKNLSANYFVKVDAFNQTSFKYLGSWRYHVPFTFLPVNLMAMVIRVPAERIVLPGKCRLTCGNHGQCAKFLNEDAFFCRCDVGWAGKQCDRPVNCDECASDSLCVGSHENRPICLCPVNTFGRRCLLKYDCEEDLCVNNGRCLVTDENEGQESFACVCPEEFYGIFCQFRKSILHLSFQNMSIPSYILFNVYYSTLKGLEREKPNLKLYVHKMRMFQRSITLYIDEPFQIVVVRANEKLYVAVLQDLPEGKNASTTISPAQQCPSFREIAAHHLIDLPEIRRVKYFHQLCRLHSQLMCFVDESYLCFCTFERHANCIPFKESFTCQENLHCENDARCFQDHSQCSTNTFCICSDCFYGDRCQFYSKGIGLTLDDMLRYELQPSLNFHRQPVSVKVSAAVSVVLFVAGVINSFLSLMTFYSIKSRQVGAGLYLFASSITSLLTICLFNVKLWFLIITHIQSSTSRSVLRVACIGLEPTLKLCLYTDSWLNACVAIERAVSVYKGVSFNREASIRVARWVIGLSPLLIFTSLVHEFIHRDLSDDEEEQRIWCVFTYSKSLIAYHTFILTFHSFCPFLGNLLSAFCIVISTARRKADMRHQGNYISYVREQLKEYRHLIISSLVLTILSSPRIVISLLSPCVKANRNPWIYLSGYFISFIPSVVVFLVFVVPSPLYREEFKNSRKLLQQRLSRITIFTLK